MTWWAAGPRAAIATVQGFLGASFDWFLLQIGVAAALLAAIIIAGVVAAAMIGDSRAALEKLRTATSPAAVSAGARTAAASTLSAPVRKTPLTILYASETGNAEALARAAGVAANRLGFAARVVDMANTTPAEVTMAKDLLVIASTWGEGEPPQRATGFYEALMAPDAPRFESVRFAVLALGDRAYSSLGNFCETGRRLDARLAQLGGSRVAERIDCDADYEAPAAAWLGATLKELAPSEQSQAAGDAGNRSSVVQMEVAPAVILRPNSRAPLFDLEIVEKRNLNDNRSSPPTAHVALALADSGILYEPGDSLGILPHNDPVLVEEVLNAVGLSGDQALREAMGTRYDITTLTLPQLQSYAKLSADQALDEVAADAGRAAEFLGGRQLIDMLEEAPRRLSVEQFTGLLRQLQPRLYSVASSRTAVPNQAHLLIAAVEYTTHGRVRKGVASIDVVGRHRIGDRVLVYLKPNQHFRLPVDPAQPIIMIGPGTGIAPFRAFMQERGATGAKGKNWLFFGHRHRAEDFFYQSEWQDLRKRGVLSRLDVAFSRDQPEKIYVQDRMWDARRDLFAWLQDGATLYVCGNAGAMARDVNSVLLRIATDQGGLDKQGAQTWLNGLRRGGRYLRDVY